MRGSCGPGGGIGGLAVGDIPNTLQRGPLFVLHACVDAPHPFNFISSLHVSGLYSSFLEFTFLFLFNLLFLSLFALFCLFCSRWSFVHGCSEEILNSSKPSEHPPDKGKKCQNV